jgi:hypothetical protein
MPVYQPEAVADGDVGEDRPKKKFDLIPDGTWVDAVVSKVEEQTKPFNDDDGNPVKKVVFTFDFEYNGEERKTWGETSTKFVFHPGCKLRSWAQEILAADLPEEFVLNTDHLVGEKCQVRVGLRSWEAGSKDGRSWDAGSRNFADDVKRAGSQAVAPASVQTAVKDEPYEDPF